MIDTTIKIYLAGSMFNEADIAQRKLEASILRNTFKNITVFNPIEKPFNTNKESLPTSIEIFEADTQAVIDSDIFLADISNEDSGVLVELGIAISNNKTIIVVNSDIRLKSANKYDIPSYSMNHYVLGGILKHGYLVHNFNEAISTIENLIPNLLQQKQ